MGEFLRDNGAVVGRHEASRRYEAGGPHSLADSTTVLGVVLFNGVIDSAVGGGLSCTWYVLSVVGVIVGTERLSMVYGGTAAWVSLSDCSWVSLLPWPTQVGDMIGIVVRRSALGIVHVFVAVLIQWAVERPSIGRSSVDV